MAGQLLRACASIRADISRVTDIDYFEVENDWFEMIPVKGAPISGVTDGFSGLGRLARLAVMAINDLFSSSGLPRAALSDVGVYSGLPSPSIRENVDASVEQNFWLRVRERSSFTWKGDLSRWACLLRKRIARCYA